MPRLLLVNPWIFDFAAYDFWLKPIGLLSLAESLKQAGFEIELIDLTNCASGVSADSRPARLKRLSDGRGKFLSEIIPKPEPLKKIPRRYKRYGVSQAQAEEWFRKAQKPDAILLGTTMTYWYPGYMASIELLRKVFPQTPIIAGGLYVTLLPEHARKNLPVDFLCTGDYEASLPLFLQKIFSKTFSLKSPEQIKLGLDLYPYLDYGIVLSGRGCPFRCKYCVSWKLHPNLKRKPVEMVVEEIEWQARALGVKNIAFYDDALLLNPEQHILLILEGVIRKNLNIKFHTPNGLHLKPVSRELAELMKRAGFGVIRFGLETADKNRQKTLGAKAYLDDLAKALEYLEQAGYSRREIGIYLLAGLPGQTAEEIEKDVRAVKKLGARPYLSEYSPIPGTELWQEAIASARFDFVNEPLFQNCSLLASAHPSLTPQKLSYLRALCKE